MLKKQSRIPTTCIIPEKFLQTTCFLLTNKLQDTLTVIQSSDGQFPENFEKATTSALFVLTTWEKYRISWEWFGWCPLPSGKPAHSRLDG
jgi:hypothetical protein